MDLYILHLKFPSLLPPNNNQHSPTTIQFRKLFTLYPLTFSSFHSHHEFQNQKGSWTGQERPSYCPEAGVKKQRGRTARANNPATRSSNRLRGIPALSPAAAAAAVLVVAAPFVAAAPPAPPAPLLVVGEAEKLEFHIKASTK